MTNCRAYDNCLCASRIPEHCTSESERCCLMLKEVIRRIKLIEKEATESPKHSFTYGDVLRMLVHAVPELKTVVPITSKGEKQNGQ